VSGSGPGALSGDLGIFYPAEVLQLLRLARATGRLDLERRDERVEVFVEEGRPMFARSSGPSVRTGDILIHRGEVSREALDMALALQADEPGQRVGEILAASGAVDPEGVRRAVLEVQRRIVYRVLLWQEGTFRFEPREREAGEDIPIDLDLERLILEGLRLADQTRAAGEGPRAS
jgi:hypothetical protein